MSFYGSKPAWMPGGVVGSSAREQHDANLSMVLYFRKARDIATGKVESANRDDWTKEYLEMLKDEGLMRRVKKYEGKEIFYSPWRGEPILPPAWS